MGLLRAPLVPLAPAPRPAYLPLKLVLQRHTAGHKISSLITALPARARTSPLMTSAHEIEIAIKPRARIRAFESNLHF